MNIRKRPNSHPIMEKSNIVKRRRQRPRLKVKNAPPVSSIKDLIEIGQTLTYYKNLNSRMLWKITPYLEELDKMIGMDSLKETLFFQIIYYLQDMHTRNKDGEYLHTLIMGKPGHGKTEISRIIGKIYQAMGVLSSDGPFKIAHRDDFIAEYLGQSAIKTKKLLKSCLGGILFIDEVYALAPARSDRDSFAKEAIDTLNSFLSEHKNDFCCIAAGYEEDIKNCFFAMNKGLERRFPWVHKIEPYTSKELSEIFMKMINEINWHVNFSIDDVRTLIDTNSDFFKNAGGDIETFISKCKMLHSQRVFSLEKEYRFVLTKEDLSATIEYIKKFNKTKEETFHLSMYT